MQAISAASLNMKHYDRRMNFGKLTSRLLRAFREEVKRNLFYMHEVQLNGPADESMKDYISAMDYVSNPLSKIVKSAGNVRELLRGFASNLPPYPQAIIFKLCPFDSNSAQSTFPLKNFLTRAPDLVHVSLIFCAGGKICMDAHRAPKGNNAVYYSASS